MSNQTENNLETNQSESQEEHKPLFGGVDSQGKERMFASAEEAQQSWQNSQDFIKKSVGEKKELEDRVRELEAELNQRLKLEDALSQLKSKEESPVTNMTNDSTTETTPQLDVDQLTAQITESIMGKLSASQRADVEGKNQMESIEAAKSVYGEDYESKLREKALEYDMSDDDIISEAKSNPKRFKKLFGLDKHQTTTVTPSGTSSGPLPNQEKKLNFAKQGVTTSQMLKNHQENIAILMEKYKQQHK